MTHIALSFENNINIQPSTSRSSYFVMTALDFNDRGQANVSFSDFNNYMNERKEQSDYT